MVWCLKLVSRARPIAPIADRDVALYYRIIEHFYYLKGRNICKEIFAEEIFAEFIYTIYDLIRQNLFRKNKKMLLLTKNSTIFKENIQKLDTIRKNLFAKHSAYGLLNRKNEFRKNFFRNQFLPFKKLKDIPVVINDSFSTVLVNPHCDIFVLKRLYWSNKE